MSKLSERIVKLRKRSGFQPGHTVQPTPEQRYTKENRAREQAAMVKLRRRH